MTRKLMLGAALSALLVSGALAQAPTAPPSSNPPPAVAQDKSAPTGKADFVMSQKPDQWLASKFKGTNVIGADSKKIGDVTDILFDKTGKIEAFVVSIGGFLGMGAKEVALAPSAFAVVPGENGAADKLKVSLSQDDLKQAQNFARYSPPRPTTTGAAPMNRPAMPSGPTGR